MKHTLLSFPELALVVGTRAAAGLGLGLLLAGQVNESTRRTVGWGLVLFGLATTLPLAATVLERSRVIDA